MAAKQPAFYNKHFGHFANDAAIAKQGRLTLTAVCDIACDLRDGNDDAGLGKIDNVCQFHNMVKKEVTFDQLFCQLVKSHAAKGRTKDAADYKVVVDVLVDYLAGAAGDKCNANVKKVFNVILVDAIKGSTGKL